MKRNLILAAALVCLGLASTANAATSVSLTSNKLTPYNTGEVITLTVTVTADAGETDTSVFGVVQYQGALVAPVAASQQQNQLPATAAGPWNIGVLPACTTVNCRAFSQTNAGGAINTANFVIATLQFTASAPGTANFVWQSAPVSQRLDFFGITSDPGTSVTIVPEPTTATMLGLGLFGLAMAGRRRA